MAQQVWWALSRRQTCQALGEASKGGGRSVGTHWRWLLTEGCSEALWAQVPSSLPAGSLATLTQRGHQAGERAQSPEASVSRPQTVP